MGEYLSDDEEKRLISKSKSWEVNKSSRNTLRIFGLLFVFLIVIVIFISQFTTLGPDKKVWKENQQLLLSQDIFDDEGLMFGEGLLAEELDWVELNSTGPLIKARSFNVDGLEVAALTAVPPIGSPIATVLLLHAAAYASDIWKRTGTLQALATSGILAVAVDLPGHGKTGAGSIASTDDRVSFVRGLVRQLGLRLVIVAPSSSGEYALPFVERYCRRVAAFVPVAPFGLHGWRGPPESCSSELDVMAVYGERDPMLEDARDLVKMFPKTKLATVPDADHLCYLTDPKFFNAQLVQFVLEHFSGS